MSALNCVIEKHILSGKFLREFPVSGARFSHAHAHTPIKPWLAASADMAFRLRNVAKSERNVYDLRFKAVNANEQREIGFQKVFLKNSG